MPDVAGAPAPMVPQGASPSLPPEVLASMGAAPVQNGPDFQSRAPGSSPYQTPLSTADEGKFQSWVKKNRIPFDSGKNADYDMRGYWQAQQGGDPNAKQAGNQHFPDTWKTPFHKTVSNESMYAPANAPHWVGNVLTAPDGTVVADERSKQERATAAKQAAYEASPEGQIAGAANEQKQILNRQADVATAQGNVAAQEVTDNETALAERARNVDLAQVKRDQVEADRAKQEAASQEKISKAIDVEASYKIDDNRRWNNMGTGRQILASMAVIMSGLGDVFARKSGPNAALTMLTDAIKDDVASQVRDKENMGRNIGRMENSLDRYHKQTGDLRDAANMKIAEEYKRTADQFEMTAAKYASPKAKLAAMSTANELRMRAAELAGKTGTEAFNRDVKRQELANQRQQTAISGGQLALAGKHLELEKNKFAWDKVKDAAAIDAAAQAAAAKGDPAMAKLISERSIGGETVAVKDAEGNVVSTKTGPITMSDGSIFIPKGTEATVTQFQAQHDSVQKLVATLSEIRKIGPEWLSDTANSDKLQRLKQLMADAKLETVAAKKLGVIAGPDEALIGGFLGTDDPTRRKDSLAGIDQSLDSLVRGHNIELHNRGLDKDWTPLLPKNMTAPTETPTDVAMGKVMGDPLREQNPEDVARDLGGTPFLGGVGAHDPSSQAATQKWQENGGMLTGQRSTLDNFAAMAKSSDPKIRGLGVSNLDNAANKAALPGVRAYARHLLTNGIAPPAPTEEAGGPTGTATARDTSYGATK